MIGTEGNRAELGLQSISSISRAKIKIDKFHSESIFNWKMTLLFLAELLRVRQWGSGAVGREI